ncbi:N-acetylmuramoyl-L-alanine amidase [Moraxella catarrhalis]|uniref:N-acetylmuramoyl-L-alanine amidase n=1 Tax=Moraxella catarrhalis TaxID=480 RepID=UPI00128BC2CA|nr:N-acetylmuramoyl-L-alanine amidase [Moraxella catarrhalis]MPY07374.1 N-acetylmuramoyl-L-alanine amidase [Moraxella catarrhalis]
MTSNSTTSANQASKATPTIVLTAGHGGGDVGAVNTNYQNKTHTESNIACEMRNIVAHILKNDYGMRVKTDGIAMGNLPLRNALPLIRGSALAIDFHTNASANKTATGIECLILPKNKTIAQKLCQAVADVTGWKLRGDKGYKPDNAGQHSRLAYAQAGGLVFEPFFISNDDDLALWYGKKWLICRAVADAIAKHFGADKVA